MRAAKLIKAQGNTVSDTSAQQIRGRQRISITQAIATASDWVKDYQQKKSANPREQFARLFDLSA